MINLNIVEKLVLCILNKEKSDKFLSFNEKYPASIGASVFMELFLEDVIELNEDKKVVVKNELNSDKDYLKAVYERIESEKPKNLKKWIEAYGAGFSTKAVKNIVISVAESLERYGVLDTAKEQGLFKEKVVYYANEEIVNSIKKEIRTEFLENGTLTKECVSLTALVNQCELLNKDLSKDEKKLLKQKLKEIKKNGMVEGIKELQDVIDEIDMAVMAAIVAGTV